jgi:NAD-dependent DNA ligase
MPDERLTRQNYAYDDQEQLAAYRASAVERKQQLYWIGFLAGARASGRIESGEPEAIHAEATRFATFFECPDARDLLEDIAAECFASESDLIDSLDDIISSKRNDIEKDQPISASDDLNEFLGFCAGIICDGRVLEKEIRAIHERFLSSPQLRSDPLYAGLRDTVSNSLGDGLITDDEALEVQEWLARLVGDGFIDTGIANIGNVAEFDVAITDPAEVLFDGKHFALTGPMRMGTRSSIVARIEAAGGAFDGIPNRKTDYVVVATTASQLWRTTHYGNKIEKTTKLIDQGFRVRFVTESAFEIALANTDDEGIG